LGSSGGEQGVQKFKTPGISWAAGNPPCFEPRCIALGLLVAIVNGPQPGLKTPYGLSGTSLPLDRLLGVGCTSWALTSIPRIGGLLGSCPILNT
jgi:hypothetical protein